MSSYKYKGALGMAKAILAEATPNNPTPELDREALVGKLWAMHGIAQVSENGFTYLNDAARVIIAEAAATIASLTAEKDALQREVDHFTSSGIVEVAVRNTSVMEYMKHWEGRAEAAEKRVKELEGVINDEDALREMYYQVRRRARSLEGK